MNPHGSSERLHVIFSGRVQGVGFRFTVAEIAAPYPLTGLVRNLWDGTVELIAEGTETDLMGFLNDIHESRLKRNILNERVQWKPITGEYDRFGIGHS